MAKWWLLGVEFPERADLSFIQIYSDTAESARSLARTLFVQHKLMGADEHVSIEIRDSSDSPFSNPVIGTEGLRDVSFYTGGGTPPPGGGGGGGGGGGLIGPPEKEVRARFLQGLQQRGVNLGSISGRAMAQQEDEYLPAFQFRQGLQGFSPNPTRAGEYERFVKDRDIRGARGEAAAALKALLASGGGSGTAGVFHQQFDNPETTQAQKLAQLAYSALASRVDPLALQLLRLPEGSDIRDRFLAERGGAQGGFLDYFKQQYPMLAGL